MSTLATKPMTIAEFESQPLERVELVRGEIVEMPPPGGVHGAVCINAGAVLALWCREHDGYVPFGNDCSIVTGRDPDTVRGADALVVRRDKLPGGRIPIGSITVPAELAVEVKSPSDRWAEMVRKVGEYLACGVLEVWIVDPDHRRVHVYTPDDEPTVLDETDELTSTALPGFTTPVTELFRGL
jgi:Uma2 family endonuclease